MKSTPPAVRCKDLFGRTETDNLAARSDEPCPDFNHEWKDEYYGTRCQKCDLFFPDGCAPWDEPQELECCSHCGKDIYDFSDLGCGYCDRRNPEFGLYD
ncbi:MAG: hypothetical protein MSG64_15785 [Pyrinomonadaceae bacterium MAG19_C2-C3]|nr:hypothetical protein [Pyrinomonadaceae bacterium MAG19_C2-C3]